MAKWKPRYYSNRKHTEEDSLGHKLNERWVAGGRVIPAEADPEDLMFEGDLDGVPPPAEKADLCTLFAAPAARFGR